MANVDVLDVQGKKSGSVELDASLFDVNISIPLVHQVVVAQMAAARQGTQSTKRHGEVSGTGKKPFAQKGTGRARQGSLRAPQMRGGYITHGPKPRDYDQRTPKKMKAAAVRQALTDRARNNRLHVVESLGLSDKPSTKAAQAFLAMFTKQKNVLVVLDRTDEVSYLSLRNLKNVHVLPVDQLNAYDILNSDDLVFTKSAIEEFTANSKKEA
ncbi:MAG: 50S ribosomal protein L4 [Rhodoluna sp.]|jgi:large subunit ribosomal protein L4|nr:50S ribosomal protein L4 [Rhodoluna sp.]